MSRLYSKLCHRMQMKIMDILLKDIYVGKDCSLQKSRIYVKKGRALRACGTEGLRDCIHCLSQAIHTLVSLLASMHFVFPFFLPELLM